MFGQNRLITMNDNGAFPFILATSGNFLSKKLKTVKFDT